MFITENLTEIRQRKQAVIAHIDLQRAMLQLEMLRLRPYLGYLDTGARLVRTARPVWLAGAPLLGFWAIRRLRKMGSWLPSAFIAWGTIQKGLAFWRGLRKSTVDAPGPIPTVP